MNRLTFALALLLCALPLAAQNPVRVARGRMFDSTATTVPNSSTAIATITTTVQYLHCANTTGSAVTFTLTDNQSSPKSYYASVSIAANSVLTEHFGTQGMPFKDGIKWSAGTADALVCHIVGEQ